MTASQQKAIAPLSSGGDRPNQNVFSPNSNRSPKFQHSSKGHPCPLCGRVKDNDCRWNEEVVLCHTHVEQDAGIPGYVYRGQNDIWGQYFPESKPAPKPTRPKAQKEFIYCDHDGQPLVKVTRKDDGKGGKKIYQSHWDGSRWKSGLGDLDRERLRLYRIADSINQEAIAQQQPILIVEGEGKVDLLLGMGIAATCSIGGAGKWRKYGYPNYLKDLQDAVVVLCPDRDQPGVKHCLDIEQDFPNAQWLYAFPNSAEWENLPKKNGLDIADWVAQENLSAEQILGAIVPKSSLHICQKVSETKDEAVEDSEARKTIAQLLLEVADQGTYFHTPGRKAYVDIHINGIRQTLRVRSSTFKQWLQQELYLQYGKTVGSETLNQVLGLLEGKANFRGEEREAFLRIAEWEGKVYLDLGREDWQAIEVDTEGWRLVSEPPVRFRRVNNLLALPQPQTGGSLTELRELVNMDDDAWVLAINWLLFSFYPKYPHPILVLHGEQGTGKSYTANLLKALIDPGKAPLIPNVADLRNLAIAAENRWVLAYDNLSHLSADQSDALCRISTGGGFSTRTLYEDDEETVFEFIRPQMLTGIDSLASRGDLLERSLMVRLSRIPEEERLTEAELNAKLEQLQGRILGALLTALSETLKRLPDTKPEKLPRMADFARFAIAAETALDLPVGSFLQVYAGNRQEAHETALEASPVALAIQQMMATRQSWRGTATDLLTELAKLVDDRTRQSKGWAGNARSLGKALTRLAPDLQGIGIEVKFERTNSKRCYQIDKVVNSTSPMSLTSNPAQDTNFDDDITPSSPVTDDEKNVTGISDMSAERHWQTPQKRVWNVTTETGSQHKFQGNGDESDVSDDTDCSLSSNLVGKKVKKRHRLGWMGTVQSIHGDWAEVLWSGEKIPTSVGISELEEIA